MSCRADGEWEGLTSACLRNSPNFSVVLWGRQGQLWTRVGGPTPIKSDRLERWSQMAKGTIRRLITGRGYGFITTEEGKDLFFHSTGLQGVTYDSLTEGQKVEFELEQTEKGPNARNMRLAGGGS